MLVPLLLDVARGSYEQHIEAICTPFWAAARIAARDAVLATAVNVGHPTPGEQAAAAIAHDTCPMPVTLPRIHLAIQEKTGLVLSNSGPFRYYITKILAKAPVYLS